MEIPRCAELDPIFYYDARPSQFERRLEEIDGADFRRLFRCRTCGQYWRIDEWDKYQAQLAVKLPETAGWRDFNSGELEESLLERSRGGTSGTPCAWANCEKFAVNGVALCARHLRASGVQR